jgi:hypothetical protein
MDWIGMGCPKPDTGRARISASSVESLLNCRPIFAGFTVIPTTSFASLTCPSTCPTKLLPQSFRGLFRERSRSRGSSVMAPNEPVIVVVGGLGAGSSWANGWTVYRPISNRGVKPLRALNAT